MEYHIRDYEPGTVLRFGDRYYMAVKGVWFGPEGNLGFFLLSSTFPEILSGGLKPVTHEIGDIVERPHLDSMPSDTVVRAYNPYNPNHEKMWVGVKDDIGCWRTPGIHMAPGDTVTVDHGPTIQYRILYLPGA